MAICCPDFFSVAWIKPSRRLRKAPEPTATSRMGVNMRNFDPDVLGPLRIRLLYGADTWKCLG